MTHHTMEVLAEKILRTAQLESMSAPKAVLAKEYREIKGRLATFDLHRDGAALLDCLEQALIKNVAGSLDGTSCMNCTQMFDCPKITTYLEEQTPDQVFPHLLDAINQCPEYEADLKRFTDQALLFPPIAQSIESMTGLRVNLSKVAMDLTRLIRKWSDGAARKG